MLTRLTIQNFRSIEESSVELAPITIFFGPTSAGKSTLFYGLLALRNFVVNPNQAADGFFNLGFQNLGGFEACVFDHQTSNTIGVVAEFSGNRLFGVGLRKTEADIHLGVRVRSLSTKVPIPYGANQNWTIEAVLSSSGEEAENEEDIFIINWNGFACTVTPKVENASNQSRAVKLAGELNYPAEAIKNIDICPHRRGFYKPSYSPGQMTAMPTTEDEVATLIINDQNSAPRISINTDEIFDREFRTYTAPGTATVFFQTTERSGARIPGYLVNDGFGVNQIVYMLAKIHRREVSTILIEEPEVHLHPTVVRKLAMVMSRIVSDEKKQLLITTHSEQFLMSILACVKKGLLAPHQVRCYLASRDKKRTRFTEEKVSEDGQIAGGLSSFLEAELEDIKTFLSPSVRDTITEEQSSNVYVEARSKGRPEGIAIDEYVVEDRRNNVLGTFATQREAIDWARMQGHSPLVARVRDLNDKKAPDHWRAA